MDGEDEDPFASIAKLCQIPPSQQLILRNCRFAYEHEYKLKVFSGDGGVGGGRGGDEDQSQQVNYGTAVESTGIVMVSLPETPTPKDESDTSGGGNDQFHTPPEGPNLLVGSEEQGIAAFVDCDQNIDDGGGGEILAVDVGGTEGEKMVDLGKDSDLGFSESQNILISSDEHRNKVVDHHHNEARIGGGETDVVDEGCADGEGIVELGKDSQGLSVVRRIEDDVSEQNHDVSGEKPAKRLKLSKEPECTIARAEELEESNSLERNEVMWDEDVGLVSYNGPEIIDLVLEQNGGVLGIGMATEKEDSTMMMGDCVDKEKQRDLNNVEATEKFRYDVGSSGTDSRQEGRRQLPPSILGQVENVAGGGNSVSSISSPANQSFDCLMNLMKVLAERCEPKSDDADILVTAMRRGMTFPRPIWWPAEYRPSWWPQGFGED